MTNTSHRQQPSLSARSGFHSLHPDNVINLVEDKLGRDFSNLFRPLNSYINRVFELEDLDGNGIIVKFYRPGRWSREAVLDEHGFLFDLREQEIPVIAPLQLVDGSSLGDWESVCFAVFEKCGGRSIDEFTEDQWQELGRLVGRTHSVGQVQPAPNRQTMLPQISTASQIEYLAKHNLVPQELQGRFFSLARQLVDLITPLFENARLQRVHGDLHLSNIIHRPGESFYLIDFDDMVMGPTVQDIWMLLPDYVENSFLELENFLEGYETFNRFDRSGLRLIEPLRAMRYIHYLAWCGHQVVEDGVTEVIPNFTSYSFWQTETGELADQLERIREVASL